MQTKYIGRTFLLMIIYCSYSMIAIAQENTATKSKWKYYVEPYLMIANMKGTTGIKDLPNVNVDADASDIFKNLKIGGMLYGEAHNDKWAFTSDMIYMNLQQDVASSTIVHSGNIEMKQFAWELAGLYRVLKWLELGAGARLNILDAGFDINTNTIGGGTINRSKSLKETWVDPIIIARSRIPIVGDRFFIKLRADMGGFGIGSKFAWQVQADAAYRVSKLLQLGLGYRVISVDYEKGTGSDRFLYDVNTFGPVIRIGFNF